MADLDLLVEKLEWFRGMGSLPPCQIGSPKGNAEAEKSPKEGNRAQKMTPKQPNPKPGRSSVVAKEPVKTFKPGKAPPGVDSAQFGTARRSSKKERSPPREGLRNRSLLERGLPSRQEQKSGHALGDD